MNIFDVSFANSISEPSYIHEFEFLEEFHIYKIFNNTLNYDTTISPLSDNWNHYIKTFVHKFHMNIFNY